MSESIRSFIAFDLNNEQVLKRLSDVQASLVKTGADLRPVEPRNIHVTVRFLGNITLSTVDRVYEEMQQVQFTPFAARLQGLGAFPDIRYPRVCWAGITEGADQLQSIFTQLEPRLQDLSIATDSKGFSPHLTIARVRSGKNKADLARFIAENASCDFGVIKADCLRLKKSDLTPKGPIYSTLREVCP